MREQKYRVWDDQNKQMIYFTLDHLLGNYCDESNYVDLFEKPLFAICQDINVNDVMQFTGLKDKNGQEIYEGDIVRVEDYDIGTVQYGIAVFFIGFANGHKLALQETCQEWLEVIGNVHEHRELLEGNTNA